MLNQSSSPKIISTADEKILKNKIKSLIKDPSLIFAHKTSLYERLRTYVNNEEADTAHRIMAYMCMACIHAANYQASFKCDGNAKFKQVLCLIDAEISPDIRLSYILRYLSTMIVAKALNKKILYDKLKRLVLNLWPEWLWAIETEFNRYHPDYLSSKLYILEVAFSCLCDAEFIKISLDYCCERAKDEHCADYIIPYLWQHLSLSKKMRYLIIRQVKKVTNRVEISLLDNLNGLFFIERVAGQLLFSKFVNFSMKNRDAKINIKMITHLFMEADNSYRERCFDKLIKAYLKMSLTDQLGEKIEDYLLLMFDNLDKETQQCWLKYFIGETSKAQFKVKFLSYIINYFEREEKALIVKYLIDSLESYSSEVCAMQRQEIWMALDKIALATDISLYRQHFSQLLVLFDKAASFYDSSDIILMARIIEHIGIAELESEVKENFKSFIRWATFYFEILTSKDKKRYPLTMDDMRKLFSKQERRFVESYIEIFNKENAHERMSGRTYTPKIFTFREYIPQILAFLECFKEEISEQAFKQFVGFIEKGLTSEDIMAAAIALKLIVIFHARLPNKKYLAETKAWLNHKTLHNLAMSACVAQTAIDELLQKEYMNSDEYQQLDTVVKVTMASKLRRAKLDSNHAAVLDTIYADIIRMVDPNSTIAANGPVETESLTSSEIALLHHCVDLFVKLKHHLTPEQQINIVKALIVRLGRQAITDALCDMIIKFTGSTSILIEFVHLHGLILAEAAANIRRVEPMLNDVKRVLRRVYLNLSHAQVALDHILWIDTASHRLLGSFQDNSEIQFYSENIGDEAVKQSLVDIIPSGAFIPRCFELMKLTVEDPRLSLLAGIQIERLLVSKLSELITQLKKLMPLKHSYTKLGLYMALTNLCSGIIHQHMSTSFEMLHISLDDNQYLIRLAKQAKLAFAQHSETDQNALSAIIMRSSHLPRDRERIQPLVEQLQNCADTLPSPFLLRLVIDVKNESRIVDALMKRISETFDCIPHVFEIWPKLSDSHKQKLGIVCLENLCKLASDANSRPSNWLETILSNKQALWHIFESVLEDTRLAMFKRLAEAIIAPNKQESLVNICSLIRLFLGSGYKDYVAELIGCLFENIVMMEKILDQDLLTEIAKIVIAFDESGSMSQCTSVIGELTADKQSKNILLLNEIINKRLAINQQRPSEKHSSSVKNDTQTPNDELKLLIPQMLGLLDSSSRSSNDELEKLIIKLNVIIKASIDCTSWEIQAEHLVTSTEDKDLTAALRSALITDAFYSRTEKLVKIPITSNNINVILSNDFSDCFVSQLAYYRQQRQASSTESKPILEKVVTQQQISRPKVDVKRLYKLFNSAYHKQDFDRAKDIYQKLEPHLNLLAYNQKKGIANRIKEINVKLQTSSSIIIPQPPVPTITQTPSSTNKTKQGRRKGPTIGKPPPSKSVSSSKKQTRSDDVQQRKRPHSKPVKVTMSFASACRRYGVKMSLSELDLDYINVVVKPQYIDLKDILANVLKNDITSDFLFYNALYVALRFFTSLANLLRSDKIYQARHVIAHNFMTLNLNHVCDVFVELKDNKILQSLIEHNKVVDKIKLADMITRSSAFKTLLQTSKDSDVKLVFSDLMLSFCDKFMTLIQELDNNKGFLTHNLHAKLEQSPIKANACKMLIICIIEMYHRLAKKRRKDPKTQQILKSFHELMPDNIKGLIAMRNEIAHYKPKSDAIEDAQQMFFKVDDVPTKLITEAKQFISILHQRLKLILGNSKIQQHHDAKSNQAKPVTESKLSATSPIFQPLIHSPQPMKPAPQILQLNIPQSPKLTPKQTQPRSQPTVRPATSVPPRQQYLHRRSPMTTFPAHPVYYHPAGFWQTYNPNIAPYPSPAYSQPGPVPPSTVNPYPQYPTQYRGRDAPRQG